MKKNYLYSDLSNHNFVPVFFETMDLYMRYKVINPNDFVVYQTLMRFLCRDKSSKHYGYTYITIAGISNYTGVSSPTVSKALVNLEKAGLIQIHENPYRTGKFQKYRYTIFEPLPKNEFFKEFQIEETQNAEIEEAMYSQPNECPEDKIKSKPKATKKAEKKPKADDGQEVKAKANSKKKQFFEKEVETWNYNDFISFFSYKYREAYNTEYRIGNFAKENKRLKSCCTTYFNSDKIAFMFYIEELFKKRKQFETTAFPTISLGTVCTFTNAFKLDKFFKMSKLEQNKTTESEKNIQVDKNIDNKGKDMIQSNIESNTANYTMNEETQKAFDEIKSLFS